MYIDPAQPSQITAHAEVIVGPWSYPPGHIHEHSWGEALADPVFTIDPSWEYASQFQLVYSSKLGCYANCDNSTASPALNVADFSCFLQKYAAGDPYANCDLSTTPPVLNVQDFTCFLQKYSAGCP